MKVTILDQDYYSIYLSHAYSLIDDFSNKELIGDYAKNIIVKLKKTYGIILNGYYQMKVFVNDKVGMFLELRKLDDIDFDLVLYRSWNMLEEIEREPLEEETNVDEVLREIST